jgi:branched-chain amino acid transport system permease protein
VHQVEQRGWRMSAPVALLAIGATLLLSAGGVFVVEMLQRLCSQDYRALAQSALTLPSVALLGRPWSPIAASTWLVPLGLLASGSLLALAARRRAGLPS